MTEKGQKCNKKNTKNRENGHIFDATSSSTT